MTDAAARHLNTAASPTFTKSGLFYGLHEAAQAGGRHPVLVEGPLDALALAAADGHDLLPIATGGTVLPAQHATQLAAWCRHHNVEPVIAYDPDPAGCAAALRAGELLRDHGLDSHIAALPAGLDPADHLATCGDLIPYRAQPAGTAIPLAVAVTEQIITTHHGRSNPDWPETKVLIARDIGRHLADYSDALLAHAAAAACTIATTRAGIHPDTLLRTIAACRPRSDIHVTAAAPGTAGRTR